MAHVQKSKKAKKIRGNTKKEVARGLSQQEYHHAIKGMSGMTKAHKIPTHPPSS